MENAKQLLEILSRESKNEKIKRIEIESIIKENEIGREKMIELLVDSLNNNSLSNSFKKMKMKINENKVLLFKIPKRVIEYILLFSKANDIYHFSMFFFFFIKF